MEEYFVVEGQKYAGKPSGKELELGTFGEGLTMTATILQNCGKKLHLDILANGMQTVVVPLVASSR